MKKIKDYTWIEEIAITAFVALICIIIICIGNVFYINGNIDAAELGFIGSIIGGGMTLIGVYLTISYNNKIYKDEKIQNDILERRKLSIEYKPVIQIEDKNVKIDSRFYETNDIIKISKLVNIEFTIKNIGRGEIVSGEISSKYSDDYIMHKYNQSISNMFPQDTFVIKSGIYFHDVEEVVNKEYKATIPYVINYTDCASYENIVEILVSITFVKDKINSSGYNFFVNIDNVNRVKV